MGISTTMKRALVGAALAATAFGAAAPAMAQAYGYGWGYGYAPAAYGYGGWDAARALHDREDRIGGWIRSARDSGRIGGWQADHAFGDLQRVRDDERRARWSQDGGLRGDQVARLNDRLSLIADELRLDHDRDAGGYAYRLAPPPPPRAW